MAGRPTRQHGASTSRLTCGSLQVLQYGHSDGPRGMRPLLRVLLSFDDSMGLPWGVECAKGYLIVTVHSPQRNAHQTKTGPSTAARDAAPRILVYNAATMQLLHCIQDARLRHPNNLTWDKAEHSRGGLVPA